ncbi:MAG: hypothetical protein HOM68_29070 [Gemmatimonadetes bacterium]|jgi:hypothetical protein|nr:hypothetical protein [Gemmatimonadota bacterium]MBT5060632.1 hypothetical protein [Gemmatimonadota bacterium]MBT5141608.1 hypothetical protein [Gemmatimonadota bacterium]MBT5590911.1 hypothetical protein [Gemmatimonadota bacterium]MBT5965025.1 hypothetical protein [Gemmatimonadota bacterium]
MPHPTTNADGLPTIPLTEDQRFIFDTRGWLLLPSVLTAEQITTMREFCYRLKEDSDSIPPHHRSSVGGPLEQLSDHPVVMGFMDEFVSNGYAGEDAYGFRMEGTFLTIRGKGHNNFAPHGGRGLFNFPGNSHTYHQHHDRAHSGLTRVVWELNPVERGEGGTLLLTGSHKGAFPPPASTADPTSDIWDDYECPAGSALIFTEALCHSGAPWENDEVDRVSVFNCYNVIGNKWHKWEPHPEHLQEMPFKRQTLFRPVYCQDNVPSEADV